MEKTVVFTITINNGYESIKTKNKEFSRYNEEIVSENSVLHRMVTLTEWINNKGYAVLFEIVP